MCVLRIIQNSVCSDEPSIVRSSPLPMLASSSAYCSTPVSVPSTVSDPSTPVRLPSSSSPMTAVVDIEVPSVWTANTQRCLNEKKVTPDMRKEIVHTMSIMIVASCESPTAIDCERVANSIVLKYPFLAGPFGKSQVVNKINNFAADYNPSGFLENETLGMC